MLIVVAGGTYIAYNLNLLGPMMQMTNAATNQGVEIVKERLRDFIASSDTARQALGVPARNDSDNISMDSLDSRGKKKAKSTEDDVDEI